MSDLIKEIFREFNKPGSIFSSHTIRRHYSVIPTIIVCGGAVGMAASYIVYMCVNKQDFTFRPSTWAYDPPYSKQTNPHAVAKLYTSGSVNPYVDPEIEQLKREIGCYGSNK